MSTYNIEMNMLNNSNGYDVLYPKTDYNQLINKPTIPSIPSLPLSVSNGGTGTNSNTWSSYSYGNDENYAATVKKYNGTNLVSDSSIKASINVYYRTNCNYLNMLCINLSCILISGTWLKDTNYFVDIWPFTYPYIIGGVLDFNENHYSNKLYFLAELQLVSGGWLKIRPYENITGSSQYTYINIYYFN